MSFWKNTNKEIVVKRSIVSVRLIDTDDNGKNEMKLKRLIDTDGNGKNEMKLKIL